MFHRMLLLAQSEVAAEDFFVNFSGFNGAEQIQVAPPDVAAVGLVFVLFILFWMIICLVMVVALTIIPLWIICKKAGISPYISLLILVPGVNMAIYWILALINWPNLKSDTTNSISQGGYPPN